MRPDLERLPAQVRSISPILLGIDSQAQETILERLRKTPGYQKPAMEGQKRHRAAPAGQV